MGRFSSILFSQHVRVCKSAIACTVQWDISLFFPSNRVTKYSGVFRAAGVGHFFLLTPRSSSWRKIRNVSLEWEAPAYAVNKSTSLLVSETSVNLTSQYLTLNVSLKNRPLHQQISGLTVREGGNLFAGYSNTTNHLYNGQHTVILNENSGY